MPRQLRIEYPGAIYHLVNVVTGLALRLRKNFKSICTKSEFALRFCGVTFGRLKATFLFLVMVLCFAAGVSAAGTTNGSHKIKIILIGDSTMTDSAGWGSGFKQFLDPDKVELVNASAGGRSSMSFMQEGRWTNALVLKGDYYLIQFGHNNEPGKPGRSTDMPTFIRDMNQYVDDARAIGAKPVLVTPLVRRQWDKENPGKIKSSLTPYAQEVRKIAAEKNVPIVELHDRAKELCESLGKEKCLELFSPTKTVDGTNTFDNTHLKGAGHVLFARLVVEELRKTVPELALVLRAEPVNANPADATSKIRIVLVGDSTVNDGGGWGYGFKQFLTGDIECINTAANGRSSKSFITEGRWTNALALKGDYYLIQFGHNDEPGKGPERETDPETTYTQNLARYVDEARAIGGKPILVTSLTRRNFDKSGNGKLVPSLVPYVEAMKKLAAEKSVPLVDLHARSVELCEKIGPAETAKLNPVANGKPDTTHLNAEGRVVFARLVVGELRKAVPELAPHMLAEPNPALAPSEKPDKKSSSPAATKEP